MSQVVLHAPPGVDSISIPGRRLDVVDGIVAVPAEYVPAFLRQGFTAPSHDLGSASEAISILRD